MGPTFLDPDPDPIDTNILDPDPGDINFLDPDPGLDGPADLYRDGKQILKLSKRKASIKLCAFFSANIQRSQHKFFRESVK